MNTTIIESKFDEPECIENSGDSDKYNYSIGLHGEKINHAEFRKFLREPRSHVQYRNGFLTISHVRDDNRDCHRGHEVQNGFCVNCGLVRSY